MPQFAMQLLPNPLPPRYTLTQYLIDQRKRYPEASGDFNSLMLDVGLACKAISRSVASSLRLRTASSISSRTSAGISS